MNFEYISVYMFEVGVEFTVVKSAVNSCFFCNKMCIVV